MSFCTSLPSAVIMVSPYEFSIYQVRAPTQMNKVEIRKPNWVITPKLMRFVVLEEGQTISFLSRFTSLSVEI